MPNGDLVLELNYPWQGALLEAFVEFDPEQLPIKINAARRVISARLREVSPFDRDERIALTDAMRSLRSLGPKDLAALTGKAV